MKSKIIEIRKCLDAELYQTALALALTLPDVCGQIEYPSLSSVGKRYEKWVETYIDKDEMGNNLEYWKTIPVDESVTGGERFPVFTAKNLYELRCSFLHSGNEEISSDFLDEFILVKPDSYLLKDVDGSTTSTYLIAIQSINKTRHTS